MTSSVYRLLGLNICSAIDLPGTQVNDERYDVDLREGEVLADGLTDEPPAGDLLVEFAQGNRRLYTAVRDERGYLLRIHTVCDLRISAGLDEMVVEPASTDYAKYTSVLVAGTGLAFLLTLRGELVLHGSAVRRNGAGVAFVGHSGQGKSTVAASLCSIGAELVTDDVLPLRRIGPEVQVVGRVPQLRLRDKAAVLAEAFAPSTLSRTADERFAVHLGAGGPEETTLRAIVQPMPNRSTRELRIEQLDGGQALFLLASFPRLLGWKDPDVLRRQFSATGSMAEAVPVLKAEIPWGLPLDPAVLHELLDRVGVV